MWVYEVRLDSPRRETKASKSGADSQSNPFRNGEIGGGGEPCKQPRSRAPISRRGQDRLLDQNICKADILLIKGCAEAVLRFLSKRLLAVLLLALFAIVHSLVPSRLALDWPTVALLGVALFLSVVPELEFLLPFIKKLKIGAAEVELQEKTIELAASVQQSEKSTALSAPNESSELNLFLMTAGLQRLLDTGIEAQILDLAAKDKQAALMRLAIEIEKEILLLHGMLGLRNKSRGGGLREAVEELRQNGTISAEMAEGLFEFWKVRNEIAHAQFSIGGTNPILNSTLDSGVRLLRLIKAVPRPIYRVYDPKVFLFSDKDCTQRIAEHFGVIIETTDVDGRKRYQCWPAGRPFAKGEVVGWDWDMSRQFGPAFYMGLETRKPTLGWSSSPAFIGKTEVV